MAGRARSATRGFRLPGDVRPRRYELFVDVDPSAGPRYRGEVAIEVEIDRPRRRVELHAAELRVSEARAESGGTARRGRATPRPERETVELRFDDPLPAGAATLRLAFRGRLRDDLRGLYGAAAGGRRYAFTQLEPADARRFFPCFDEPALKARFEISVATGDRNSVVSNAPAAGSRPLGRGRKQVRFRETPPLSPYLVALAVGELEASKPERLRDVPIRVLHVPGKGRLTGFALDAARACLERLEAWFGLPYPYEKLDLVAVPDFEAGAMENAGAVFFRETLLLVDLATVTLAERKRVAEVICHELAHMWYGDLVTMAWWDDLWLNEAFATWMAFQVVDAWRPEWKMWRDFERDRSAALHLDALRNTHPIYTPVRSAEEATENFDLVTYEKGAAVVRMLERYLGAAAFRRGVRRYIRRHRESNATARDLWRALSEASGQDVERVARAWVVQEGFPVLSLRRAGTRLELRQERFRLTPRPGARRGAARPRWPVPWVGRVGEAGSNRTRLVKHLLTRSRERVDLGPGRPEFVYGNADEAGFFRPQHAPEELRALAGSLDRLSAVERMGLVAHQWALVRAGRETVPAFMELAGAFGRETDPEVLTALRGALAVVREQLAPELPEPARSRFGHWVVERFAGAFAELGFEPARGEDDDTRLRRAALLRLLGDVAEWPDAIREAGRRFERYLQDRTSLEANLADAVVALAAREADAARFERLQKAAREAATPQEQRRFRLALAEARDPRLVERALRLSLTDAVPTQDVAHFYARLLANPAARERAWSFWKRHWSRLARRMPPLLLSRPIEATPSLKTPGYRRDVAAFFREHPVPTAARALRQALERFDLDGALRRREVPRLRRWLEQPDPAPARPSGARGPRRRGSGRPRRGGPP